MAGAQTGPGGVGDIETVEGFWLDASQLSPSISNNGSVNSWNDLFVGGEDHDATPGTAPEFQQNIMNGFSAIYFDGSEELTIGNQTNVNDDGPFAQKTFFVAFRTGNDISKHAGTLRTGRRLSRDGPLHQRR